MPMFRFCKSGDCDVFVILLLLKYFWISLWIRGLVQSAVPDPFPEGGQVPVRYQTPIRMELSCGKSV